MPILNTAAKQKPAAAWQDAEDMYFSPDTRRDSAAPISMSRYIGVPGPHGANYGEEAVAPLWRAAGPYRDFSPVPTQQHTVPAVPSTPDTDYTHMAFQPLPPRDGAAALLQRDRDAMRAQADAVMAGYAKKKKFPGIK